VHPSDVDRKALSCPTRMTMSPGSRYYHRAKAEAARIV
jgi:hypothetical protein